MVLTALLLTTVIVAFVVCSDLAPLQSPTRSNRIEHDGFKFYVQPAKSERSASATDWVFGIAAHASYLGSTVLVNPFQIHNE